MSAHTNLCTRGIRHLWLYVLAAALLMNVTVVKAGAVFYMTAESSSITATVRLPDRMVVGAEYQFTVPFPVHTSMSGRAQGTSQCLRPSEKLIKSWALAVPEIMDFRAAGNGPALRFRAAQGWEQAGRMQINGVAYLILWKPASQSDLSVLCSTFLSVYLNQYQNHSFGGHAAFTYEVTDPGKPGSGSVTLPAGNVPGFMYANMRREADVTEGELKAMVLSSPVFFEQNSLRTDFSWVTQQTCAVDSMEKRLDFGDMSALDFRGKEKQVSVTLSCRGGTQTQVRIDILSPSGSPLTDGVPLGLGVSVDLTLDSPDITIPLDGEKTVTLTGRLKGNVTGGGTLDGSAIMRVNFL